MILTERPNPLSEELSDFCSHMAAEIAAITSLGDCDIDTIREEIDFPVSLVYLSSLEWKKNSKAVAQAVYEAIGTKYRISIGRVETIVNSCFQTSMESELTAENECSVDGEDPSLALDTLIEYIRNACENEAYSAIPTAVGEAVQDFSGDVDVIVTELQRALISLIPERSVLRLALLEAIPGLADNPSATADDEE